MRILPTLITILILFTISACDSKRAETDGKPTSIEINPDGIPNYPDFRLVVAKEGVRQCYLSLAFPLTENTERWTRLACGIEHTLYDARIEYLESIADGDRYRITVYAPYSEKAASPDTYEIIYDEEIVVTAGENEVFRVNGVSFTTIATKSNKSVPPTTDPLLVED